MVFLVIETGIELTQSHVEKDLVFNQKKAESITSCVFWFFITLILLSMI